MDLWFPTYHQEMAVLQVESHPTTEVTRHGVLAFRPSFEAPKSRKRSHSNMGLRLPSKQLLQRQQSTKYLKTRERLDGSNTTGTKGQCTHFITLTYVSNLT